MEYCGFLNGKYTLDRIFLFKLYLFQFYSSGYLFMQNSTYLRVTDFIVLEVACLSFISEMIK